MPVTPTYPGVYIEEVPSGVRTITGVATSITAFIGRAYKGPVNKPITINSYADFERQFGGLWLQSTMSFAVKDFFLNGGAQAVIVRLVSKSGSSVATVTLPSQILSPPASPPGGTQLKLEAANVGGWGNNLYAQVDHDTKNASDNTLFNLTIFEKNSEGNEILQLEQFLNVSVNENAPRYLPNVLEEESSLVRVKKEGGKYVVSDLKPEITYVTDTGSPPTQKEGAIRFSQDGSDGTHIDDNIFCGDGTESNKEGLYALENADLFNILCIPPYANSSGSTPGNNERPTDITTKLISAAVVYCKKRRAIFIVDAHSKWKNKSKAKEDFLKTSGAYPGTTSNYAALFFPRLKQRNSQRDNQMEELVPCGAVAGIFARTDAQRGVWKAPAGQEATLVGVPQLSVQLTDAENGELNQLGINCLRTFPVYGRLVWGARTLEGADRLSSEWKYISVRRTALFIEESLYRGTKWVVFEPNDEPLWAQIRLNAGAFMHNLFRQGAFQGTTPREAYLVKCDKETTTQNDINKGIVNILVGFAPLKPAEFVFIKIQQLAGQIET